MSPEPTLSSEDVFDDSEAFLKIRHMPSQKQHNNGKRKPNLAKKAAQIAVTADLADQADNEEQFNFTYSAKLHEHAWIIDSLGGFHEEKWLSDVLRLIKGGKEAHVYQCLRHASVSDMNSYYIAAKVYRPRMFRNLRNDSMYRENRSHLDADGITIIDDRMLRAINKRTGYGQELMHTSWIEHEVKTMDILHQAGADVPQVFTSGHNAILMSYIGGEDMAAPTLNSIDLDGDEARPLFQRVMKNVEIMLAHNRIHGDLSAYNILYWEGEITLIDFPQAIEPEANHNAFRIFERDLVRVCEYFARQGVRSDPRRLAADLWTAYGHRITPEVHPAYLDADNDADRAFWGKASHH